MKGLKKNFSHFFKGLLPIGLLVIVVLIFFWKVIFKGQVPLPADFIVGVYYPWLDYKWGFPTGVPVKNPMTTDVVSFTYPMQMLAIDLLKQGKMPLWNSYILGGTPLLANFQSAPFSPTNFLYFVFDKLSAWSFQIILQHLLAAFFTFILLRHWKVSKISSILGGIVFSFSGFNLIWSQWNGHALAAAFIPLILFFEDRWLSEYKFIYGVAISISFALLLLSGYPQIAIYLGLAIFLLLIVRFKNIKKARLKTLLLGIFLLFGILLSAFQVIPGAELLFNSQREVEPHPYEWAFLPWSKVITFLAPDFFGNHATKNYWGPQDYTSNTGFVGVIAFTLALVSLAKLKINRNILFAFLLLVVSLIFAFPTPISIFLWKSAILGLNAASAHRSLVLFDLAIALLASFGLEIFRSIKFRFQFKHILLQSIILLGFGIYALTLKDLEIRGIPITKVALRNLIFPLAMFLSVSVLLYLGFRLPRYKGRIIIGILLIMISELFRFGWKFTPFSPRSIVFPTTPIIDFLQAQAKPVRITGSAVIPVNMRMPYKLESLEGYDAVYPLRISQLIAAISSGRSGTNPVGRYGTIDNLSSNFLDLVNTKFFITTTINKKGDPDPQGTLPDLFKDEKFKIAFVDKTTTILENKNYFPRAYMVYNWESEVEGNIILDKILDRDFLNKNKIILENYNDNHLDKIVKGGISQVSYLNYSEMESEISVNTSFPGMLFVSDTWYPGWKAFVDAKETKIYRADFSFRAIAIPKGKHEVKMIYHPESFYLGLKISGISVVLLGLSFVIYKRYTWK